MKTYRITNTTANAASVVEGEATPSASADGTQRVVVSCDDFGRGVSVTIKPLDASTQFVLQSIRAWVIPSAAGPEDG